jgi:hypothetical protein
MTARYSLATTEGMRWPIRPAGLLVGRAPTCELVLSHTRSSRLQAIVYDAATGPTLVNVGKGVILVDGEPIAHDSALAPGTRIDFPGLRVTVVSDDRDDAPLPGVAWVVSGPGGVFGLVRTPFTVGAAHGADLRVDCAAPHAFRFHAVGRLYVEALTTLDVDGVALEVEQVRAVGAGSVIQSAAGRFEVISGELSQPSTASNLAGALAEAAQAASSAASVDAPVAVQLDFLPRGGRLTVDLREQRFGVFLSERRCDLVASLLKPPREYSAGEFVPDESLLPLVWPGRTMSRVDLNVLIHRTRHDLVRAGLDGPTLLSRAEGGNATRFLLAPGASVLVI